MVSEFMENIGLDRDQAVYCLEQVRYRSTRAAFQYLTARDHMGRLTHEFVPVGSCCGLCEKPKTDHAYVISSFESLPPMSVKLTSNSEQVDQSLTSSILHQSQHSAMRPREAPILFPSALSKSAISSFDPSLLEQQPEHLCRLCDEEPIGWAYPYSTFRFTCAHTFCVSCV